MLYPLTDTGAVVTWDRDTPLSAPLYRLVRMTSMNDPEPQPAALFFAAREPAMVAGVAWASAEPWRNHFQIWEHRPGHGVGLAWYGRLVPGGEVGLLEPDRPCTPQDTDSGAT